MMDDPYWDLLAAKYRAVSNCSMDELNATLRSAALVSMSSDETAYSVMERYIRVAARGLNRSEKSSNTRCLTDTHGSG